MRGFPGFVHTDPAQQESSIANVNSSSLCSEALTSVTMVNL